ncbi:MAG: phospholipase D-like domain-containing protein [Gammaproteobacteria bacterium]
MQTYFWQNPKFDRNIMELENLIANYYGTLLVVLYAIIAGWAVAHALLFKTNSRAALGWIGLIILFPLAGSLLYLIFGINRVRRKAQRGSPAEHPWTEQGSLPELTGAPPTTDRLENVGWRITGQMPTTRNSVKALINGEEAYPAMLRSIQGATKEILLATYIFDNDHTGKTFVTACKEAVERGVQVRVLIDDVGRRYSCPSIVRRLRKSQIEFRRFMPLTLFPPSLSLNLRNHRKLLIIDNITGFAGGMNISDRQLVQGASRHRAADLHFQLTGTVVPELRALFEADWRASGGDSIGAVQRSTTSVEGGVCRCRVVADGPDENLDHLARLIEAVASVACDRIRILTPYFLPHAQLTGALISAAVRGVNVAIVIPARNNWPPVRWALNHHLYELLSAGVRVLEQPPPFDHSKCLLIDDEYALIGSSNLDPRSLRLNFELGIEVFSSELNSALSAYVDSILGRALEIKKDDILNRTTLVRLRDAIAALFSPYL